MVHPLLLDLAEPRRGRHPVAGRSQGLEVPFGVEVDRIGDRTARDEEALHLFEVVLQAVVVAREDARRERRFEHVALELDPVADLQSAGAVEYLHVGAVSHDLDDLGHHADTARVHVTYLVLAHGSVGLHDHDIRNDTVYVSSSFHYSDSIVCLSTLCRRARRAGARTFRAPCVRSGASSAPRCSRARGTTARH